MKPVHANSFTLYPPDEADYCTIEAALAKLMQPLGRLPGLRFIVRLRKNLMRMQLPDHCTLLDEGERPCQVYFLVSGSVLIGTNLSGQIQLNDILRSGNFVLPIKLFSSGYSAQEIRTAEPSRLLFMEVGKYRQMLEEFPEAGILTNLWREQLEELTANRKFALSELNAVARMKWLHGKWPDCFMVFSDGIIGAYLGLSRETVCRNKKIVMQKKV